MKIRYYVSVAVALSAFAVIYWKMAGGTPAAADDAPPSVLVSTINLTPGTLPAIVSAFGSIAPGPGADATVSTQASGVVSSIAVVQGQRVGAGNPLLTMSPDAQSIADYHKAEDAVAAARANRAHVAALLASHLATSADLAVADQTLNDATGLLTALQAAGTGKTRIINAPFAGVVAAVLVSPGAMQPAGAALLRMIKTSGLVAIVGVPPAQAVAIHPGEQATITLLDTAGHTIGSVADVSNMRDPATGLNSVTLLPPVSASNFQAAAGEPVKAAITTGTLSGFVVPRDAVQNDEKGDYVFQIDPKNIAHRVAVQVLGASGTQTILAPSLDVTMPMVTTGAYQLDDGTAVRTATGGTSR
ncbi:MAG: hypothetical protein B7Z80_21600 [Rhodospirillales bacterium 20-64-7]|nr:MAG: hypothetical protein B7Z80_21600 [Rhodospirillales bacterium 20-64-7]